MWRGSRGLRRSAISATALDDRVLDDEPHMSRPRPPIERRIVTAGAPRPDEADRHLTGRGAPDRAVLDLGGELGDAGSAGQATPSRRIASAFRCPVRVPPPFPARGRPWPRSRL